MTNLSIRRFLPDQRPVISVVDVSDIRITGLRAEGGDAAGDFLRFGDVNGALVQGSTSLTPVGTFLSVTGASRNISLLGNDFSTAGTPFRSERNGIVRAEGNLLRKGTQPR
jgi:hypothetical protein